MVACDDGDVVSYTVHSVCLAIDAGVETVYGLDHSGGARRKPWGHQNSILSLPSPNSTCGRLLEPWFLENVGHSAWGLATHKSNMLLAVSSNTSEIVVFAPSLSSEANGTFLGNDQTPDTGERYTAWETKGPITFRDRPLGKKVVLRGHVTNIPNINFCDNDLDPEGRYLASTDIDGYTIVWDIWRAAPIHETAGNGDPRMSNFPRCTYSQSKESGTRGWGVACLDPWNSRLRYVSKTFGRIMGHVPVVWQELEHPCPGVSFVFMYGESDHFALLLTLILLMA